MVASAGGDDAFGRDRPAEQRVERAAHPERARVLEMLELEHDVRIDAGYVHGHSGSDSHVWSDPVARRSYLVWREDKGGRAGPCFADSDPCEQGVLIMGDGTSA